MTSALNAAVGGDTRLFAIVGDPIAQARSPLVFNAIFQRMGVNAVLVPMQIPAAALETAIAGLKRIANLDGIVVTVPHKIAMTNWVDRLLPIAQKVGAINCMRRAESGEWIGEMYDGEGFTRGLRKQGHEPRGMAVFQAGAGGAGKALAHALASAGVKSLRLIDVDRAKQDALVAEIAQAYPQLNVAAGDSQPTDVDMVVNATPCGMAEGDALPFSIEQLDRNVLVADIIMKPERTPLLQRAEERGHRTHLGRHLLENQAEIVAEFFGLKPM
ncbi:shikimate dehydrogenase [Caballeronia sp. LZ034LL]|uniref:shikimate dehydrogenase family protein n=1 Tax=Caballeronia sp. LZ034LL TaxID=3038567 RepID=UPI0028579809|nr:shikimate dehydrogenase [Caballeronia sp. LZ034LL]MDR5835614.1 shikimate dehydrogenase [Caballeronia sp. LZ034LL]